MGSASSICGLDLAGGAILVHKAWLGPNLAMQKGGGYIGMAQLFGQWKLGSRGKVAVLIATAPKTVKFPSACGEPHSLNAIALWAGLSLWARG